eukprot:2093291-Prymnesium_polylepis.1
MKGTRICEHYVFWGFGGVPSPIELDLLLHLNGPVFALLPARGNFYIHVGGGAGVFTRSPRPADERAAR